MKTKKTATAKHRTAKKKTAVSQKARREPIAAQNKSTGTRKQKSNKSGKNVAVRKQQKRASKTDSLIEQWLKEMSHWQASSWKQLPELGAIKYNRYSLMLRHGRHFTPTPKPKSIRWGKKRQCYNNSFDFMSKTLTYCEGFAMMASAPGEIAHAWLVDADGNVIDRTWREPGAAYFGIPFTRRYVLKRLDETGLTGVLQNDIEKILKTGLPKSAIRKL